MPAHARRVRPQGVGGGESERAYNSGVLGGRDVLTEANIEAELSYAYLHAVASRAGFSCEWRNRHVDGAGVDATVTEDGRMLAPDSRLTYIPVDIQLKATYADLPEGAGRLSYSLDIEQ